MGTVKKWAVILGLTLLVGAPAVRAADQGEVKQMMGENFQVVLTALVGLVTTHYEGLPERLDLIRQHAEDLKGSVPTGINDFERRTFITYAFNLEYKTANLITVLKELIARDKQRPDPNRLDMDYLRAVAASHFGDMVTTCVLCHNEFRRQVLK